MCIEIQKTAGHSLQWRAVFYRLKIFSIAM